MDGPFLCLSITAQLADARPHIPLGGKLRPQEVAAQLVDRSHGGRVGEGVLDVLVLTACQVASAALRRVGQDAAHSFERDVRHLVPVCHVRLNDIGSGASMSASVAIPPG